MGYKVYFIDKVSYLMYVYGSESFPNKLKKRSDTRMLLVFTIPKIQRFVYELLVMI